MKQREDFPSGYTKTQAIIGIVLFTLGTLAIIMPTNAADLIARMDLADASLIGEEYIRAPENSIVFLSDEEREEKLNDLHAEKLQESPVATVFITTSAYNSIPGQTDASPYHTAIGSMTRDGVIASNYFPIGTKIRIPDYFGDQVFRVEDAMNPRYYKTMDIWMEDIEDAKDWGRIYVKAEIVKYGLGPGVE